MRQLIPGSIFDFVVEPRCFNSASSLRYWERPTTTGRKYIFLTIE
jgi:hypothetical protein